jgi:uncharacterized repeat protein (TIGR03803 family)
MGNLYGTTTIGGDPSCGCGLVFKLDKNAKETVLHAFSGKPDGWRPSGPLSRDELGNVYGVTGAGGSSDAGTVFKLDPSGNETILYSFVGWVSGLYPNGQLARDAKGNFYGVTEDGGVSPCFCGIVFKLDKAGIETVWHMFTGNSDGAYPYSGLTRDGAGNVYGSTYGGGGSSGCFGGGCGTVFEVDVNGKETVMHGFTGGSDGGMPFGALILDKSGNLYGTALGGGDGACVGGFGGCGVVFKLTP